jgi:hypothetical protein
VEVRFPEIGWVTFDPTPPTAPADRAGQGLGADQPDRPAAGATSSGAANPRPDSDAGAAGAGGSSGGGGSPLVPVLVVVAIACAAAVALWRWSAPRRRAGDGVDAGLRELERALPRLGWTLPPKTTLLELERRLQRAAGPASAGYVARLRQGRFSAAGAAAPARSERRSLRRELTAKGGALARLRGYLALPPAWPGQGT